MTLWREKRPDNQNSKPTGGGDTSPSFSFQGETEHLFRNFSHTERHNDRHEPTRQRHRHGRWRDGFRPSFLGADSAVRSGRWCIRRPSIARANSRRVHRWPAVSGGRNCTIGSSPCDVYGERRRAGCCGDGRHMESVAMTNPTKPPRFCLSCHRILPPGTTTSNCLYCILERIKKQAHANNDKIQQDPMSWSRSLLKAAQSALRDTSPKK